MPSFKDVFLPDTLVIGSNRSPDGQVLTSRLQNLMVSFDDASSRTQPRTLGDPPLVASRTATFLTTIEGSEPEVAVAVKIQGTIDYRPGARAVLIARLAGMTFVNDLTACARADGEFEFAHTVKVAPRSGLLTTLVLLADRDWIDGKVPGLSASVNFMEVTFGAGSDKGGKT